MLEKKLRNSTFFIINTQYNIDTQRYANAKLKGGKSNSERQGIYHMRLLVHMGKSKIKTEMTN